jgi:hypothetical protein
LLDPIPIYCAESADSAAPVSATHNLERENAKVVNAEQPPSAKSEPAFMTNSAHDHRRRASGNQSVDNTHGEEDYKEQPTEK